MRRGCFAAGRQQDAHTRGRDVELALQRCALDHCHALNGGVRDGQELHDRRSRLAELVLNRLEDVAACHRAAGLADDEREDLIRVDRGEAESWHTGRPVVADDDGVVIGSGPREILLDVVVAFTGQLHPQVLGRGGARPALDVAVETVRLLCIDHERYEGEDQGGRCPDGQPRPPPAGHHGTTCAAEVP